MESIKLDLIPGKKMPSLHASQYDDGRDYHIDLTENRVPYVLDGTETISLTVRKCDNTLVTMDIANTFADKSYIEFRTTEQMNACAGFNYGEITIEKNGTQISSLNFYLQVEGAPDEGGIQSQSEINNLARQVHDIVVEELEDNGASETGYDNSESGLDATNVQDAIDEVNTKIENIPSVDAYTKEQSDQKFATISSIPTKTSQLQNDSGFTQIDDNTESASKTYSSEKIESVVGGVQTSVNKVIEGLSDYGILQIGSIQNIYNKATNTANAYWIVASDTNKARVYPYTGWNYTELYELVEGAEYTYSGLNNLGSSPVASFFDGNRDAIVGGYFHAQTGTHTVEVPTGAKYISFSIKNADIDTFELIQTTGGSRITERVEVLESKISRSVLYDTPTPEDHDLCIVGNYGLAYSDLQNWRWAKNDALAVGVQAYSTLKFSNGETLNSFNGDTVYQIQSVTKLLSCLVAAMYIPNLSDTVTVIASDIGSETGLTIVQEGDVITYEDLLYAALLKSDNNAANALRRPIGYIIDDTAQTTAQAKIAFYNEMQNVANTIGMTNTDCDAARISAAAGVKSTANDLCKLVKYVYENNAIIRGIWGQLSHTITVTGSNPRTWTVNSTTTPEARAILPEFVGGKTGSGSVYYYYAFCWKDSNNNYYATALLEGVIAKGNRFKDSRIVIDNALT